MTALIFRSVRVSGPYCLGLPHEVPDAHGVLVGNDEVRESKFSYGGMRYAPEEVRRDFYLHSSHKALTDAFSVCACWGCSAAFRAEVERLEPGVHQFFPICITRPRSKKPILRRDGQEIGPDDFFLFNCLQLVDAVLPELSSGPGWMPPHRSGLLSFSVEADDIWVSRAAIAGRHIWHGDFHNRSGAYFFVSDELLAGFRRAGLKGFEVRPVREA